MSDYAYTYPDDLSYLDDLPDRVRELGIRLHREAARNGSDLRDLLLGADAPAAEQAALANVWGGPGAGEEFLR
jgi:hypothetical protein